MIVWFPVIVRWFAAATSDPWKSPSSSPSWSRLVLDRILYTLRQNYKFYIYNWFSGKRKVFIIKEKWGQTQNPLIFSFQDFWIVSIKIKNCLEKKSNILPQCVVLLAQYVVAHANIDCRQSWGTRTPHLKLYHGKSITTWTLKLFWPLSCFTIAL